MASSLRRIVAEIRDSVADDDVRFGVQLLWVYRILGTVSLFMTLVNVVTEKYVLMAATLAFAIACILNAVLLKHSKRGRNASGVLFSGELVVLLTFFIVSGTPEGFSAIWVCMVPACSLLLFGRRRGSILCAVMLVIVVSLFWTPFGRGLLQFNYTESFLLRFPLLYVAFFAVSLFLETIRVMTLDKLVEAERSYQYLYRHDSLTGVYNRYGFNELMDAAVKHADEHGMALLILDIDLFKSVNDRYGHAAGDAALRGIAEQLQQAAGKQGDVCRWGGEEFAVLLPDAEDAAAVAEEIRDQVEHLAVPAGDQTIKVTTSIGMALAGPGAHVDPGQLVMCADTCLYRAKESGRNRVVAERIPDQAPCADLPASA